MHKSNNQCIAIAPDQKVCSSVQKLDGIENKAKLQFGTLARVAGNRSAGKEAGFSLIEILVAFSILAISLGVLLHIFSGGLRSAILSEEYQQAMVLAQSLMARAGTDITLEQGGLQGVEQDKFTWSLQVTPFELPQTKTALDINQQPLPMQAFKVQVTVEWAEGQDNRSLELKSVHLAKLEQVPAQ